MGTDEGGPVIFTQTQALQIWNAMIYEEPLTTTTSHGQGATRPTPFTTLAAWCGAPTFVLVRDSGHAEFIHQVAVFLREVADGLLEAHPTAPPPGDRLREP